MQLFEYNVECGGMPVAELEPGKFLILSPRNDMMYCTWHKARSSCESMNSDVIDGWRLPTRNELIILWQIRNVFTSKYSFDKTWHWTIDSYDTNSAWLINFGVGAENEAIYTPCSRINTQNFRAVRIHQCPQINEPKDSLVSPSIFDQIRYEFNEKIALMVVQIYTINLTMDMSKKDIWEDGHMTNKIIKKARKLFWNKDKKDIDLAINLWECIPEWKLNQQGKCLNGNIEKTFKYLLDKYLLEMLGCNQIKSVD